MLIISNGAYKSGSTWLFRILLSMTGYALPPERFHGPDWNGTGIRTGTIKAFLEEVDYANHNYIFKGHFSLSRHIILSYPNVIVMHITRDVRDVVVSAYYYEKMKSRFTGGGFEEYYWTRGRQVAREVTQYNNLWEGAPNTFTARYERLHHDFPAQVREMSSAIGINLTAADIERIRAENTIDSLREKYNETSPDGKMQFYRKGIIGDWRNHLGGAMAADIEKIVKEEQNFPTRLDLLKRRLAHAAVGRWYD